MKLISTSTFVEKIDEFKKRDKIGGEPASNHMCDQLRLIQSYQKFVSQPLKRVVFSELLTGFDSEKNGEGDFIDFSFSRSFYWSIKSRKMVNFDGSETLKTIEDLLKITNQIELTESAIKQIGL